MAELPSEALAALARLLPNVRAQSIDATFLEGGYSNRNYRLRIGRDDLVLRVVEPRFVVPGIDRAAEHAIITGPARPLAPVLEAFLLPEGHMLTRYAPGIRLDATRTEPPRLARYIAHVHTTLGVLPSRYALEEVLQRYATHARSLGHRPTGPVERALERFQANAGALVPCHNDLNPWNVVVPSDDPTRWVTLDWEVAGMGDPWFDVVVLTEGLGLERPDEQTVIDAYAAQTGRTAPNHQELQMLKLGFVLREHLWAVVQSAMGNGREEIAGQRDTTLARLNSLV